MIDGAAPDGGNNVTLVGVLPLAKDNIKTLAATLSEPTIGGVPQEQEASARRDSGGQEVFRVESAVKPRALLSWMSRLF
ncbi:MAG: hypothetical protein OES69_04880 [Myxococcales bacterium]|nr:hypothetical protein [Myxococcales bacterium]MDH3843248.1 hypothetical protein [Myxococcales bacterium]